jgi:hypothetical protein
MSGVTVPPIVFDYAAWLLMFPEFAAVTEPRAQLFWNAAGGICDNTATSPFDVTLLPSYLNVLTAHIAALNGGLTATGSIAPGSGPQPVGRLASASEGSVSASYEYGGGEGGGPSEAWYTQTSYGALYWAMTAQYRTWKYFVGPERFPEYPYYGMFGQPPVFGPWGRRSG